MKLSVVIPCYNAASTIGDTLEALSQQVWAEPWEVLVVNNRSTDDSMAVVAGYQTRMANLRTVDAFERQGQAHALNVGVRHALGESVAFCDADDVVGSGWVAAMGAALARHEFVASRTDTRRLNAEWAYKSRANPQEHGIQSYRYPPYLPHAGGGTIGVRRCLHEQVGGFDEETFQVLHDTDFCWKLQLAGVKLVFVPDAVMHLRFRTTWRGIYRQAKSYGRENVILYRRYRTMGMPPISSKSSVASWLKLLARLPQIRTKEQWARWVWAYGWRLGRLEGSVQFKILAL